MLQFILKQGSNTWNIWIHSIICELYLWYARITQSSLHYQQFSKGISLLSYNELTSLNQFFKVASIYVKCFEAGCFLLGKAVWKQAGKKIRLESQDNTPEVIHACTFKKKFYYYLKSVSGVVLPEHRVLLGSWQLEAAHTSPHSDYSIHSGIGVQQED